MPTCATPTNPWGALESCGWPGPTNTGVDMSQCPAGLTANSGSTTRVIRVSTANTVIECQRITGSLSIEAKNVTVKNVVISYDGGAAGGSGVIKVQNGASATIDRVEVNGLNHTHACVWHQGISMSVTRMNCYGINDGVFSWADTGYSATTGDNFVVADSYFHDFTENAANGHIDGYQTEGASHGLIDHNTYLMTSDRTAPLRSGTASAARRTSTSPTTSSRAVDSRSMPRTTNPSDTSPSGGASVTDISSPTTRSAPRLPGVWATGESGSSGRPGCNRVGQPTAGTERATG